MFQENKYKEWYYNIIERGKMRILDENTYVEKHHIIPTCLQGTNLSDNIVSLTAKEHYMCHLLLTKMTTGNDKRKMLFAFGKFIQSNKHQERNFSGVQYEKIRKSISLARKGKKRSKQERINISNGLKKAYLEGHTSWNKGTVGLQVISDERKQKYHDMYVGKTFNERFGKDTADIIKERISKGKMGHTSGMTGKTHSEETKALMSQNMTGKRGKQERLECTRCGKIDATHRHIKFCKGVER